MAGRAMWSSRRRTWQKATNFNHGLIVGIKTIKNCKGSSWIPSYYYDYCLDVILIYYYDNWLINSMRFIDIQVVVIPCHWWFANLTKITIILILVQIIFHNQQSINVINATNASAQTSNGKLSHQRFVQCTTNKIL